MSKNNQPKEPASEQTDNEQDLPEPPEITFVCPHCAKTIVIAFGPTGEVDAEKA